MKINKKIVLLLGLMAFCVPQQVQPMYSWKHIAGGLVLVGGVYIAYKIHKSYSIEKTIDQFCDLLEERYKKKKIDNNVCAKLAGELLSTNILCYDEKEFFTHKKSGLFTPSLETYLQQKLKKFGIKSFYNEEWKGHHSISTYGFKEI